MRTEPLTVTHTSLYHALAEVADHFGSTNGFTISAIRPAGSGGLPGKWEVTATVHPVADPEPIVPRQFQGYEPCGCLVNDAGAHRSECPAFVTRLNGDGERYWTAR